MAGSFVLGPLSLFANGERIQRTGRHTEMPAGQMQVDGCFFKIAMPEQHLDGAQVGTGFQKVRGKTTSKQMSVDTE